MKGKIRTPLHSEVFEIGKSEGGRSIYAYKKGNGKSKILSIARLHGNEPAPTFSVFEILNESIPSNITYFSIPIANPDGSEAYNKKVEERPTPSWKNSFEETRLNLNKVDLNRDWINLTQKETQAIRNFIFKIKPHFIIDHHEFYWDKGFPPKNPIEEENGFFATYTDAIYKFVKRNIREYSENALIFLLDKLKGNFKIKLRHFAPKGKTNFSPPIYLGTFLSLNGFPKILAESWGVGCSSLLLKERILFHKLTIKHLFYYIKKNPPLQRKERKVKLKYIINNKNYKKILRLSDLLTIHKIEWRIENSRLIVKTEEESTPFIKALYYYTFFYKPNKNV